MLKTCCGSNSFMIHGWLVDELLDELVDTGRYNVSELIAADKRNQHQPTIFNFMHLGQLFCFHHFRVAQNGW